MEYVFFYDEHIERLKMYHKCRYCDMAMPPDMQFIIDKIVEEHSFLQDKVSYLNGELDYSRESHEKCKLVIENYNNRTNILKEIINDLIQQYKADDETLSKGYVCGLTQKQQDAIIRARKELQV